MAWQRLPNIRRGLRGGAGRGSAPPEGAPAAGPVFRIAARKGPGMATPRRRVGALVTALLAFARGLRRSDTVVRRGRVPLLELLPPSDGDTFVFADTGPGDFTPKDGDVEGWRYGTPPSSTGIEPRADLSQVNFDSVCGDLEAGAGQETGRAWSSTTARRPTLTAPRSPSRRPTVPSCPRRPTGSRPSAPSCDVRSRQRPDLRTRRLPGRRAAATRSRTRRSKPTRQPSGSSSRLPRPTSRL